MTHTYTWYHAELKYVYAVCWCKRQKESQFLHAPDVHLLAIVLGTQHLRGCIERRATKGLRSNSVAQSKVNQLQYARVCQQQIVQLDVPTHIAHSRGASIEPIVCHSLIHSYATYKISIHVRTVNRTLPEHCACAALQLDLHIHYRSLYEHYFL